MPNEHLSDAELVLLLDTEPAADHHVAGCPRCQERLRQLRDALLSVRQAIRPAPPQPSRRWIWIAAAAAAVAFVFWRPAPPAAGPLPDPRLTPGIVRTVSAVEVCALHPGDEGRQVTPARAERVFERYGIARRAPRQFEVDFLISPALGGADDERNQWPVPYASGVWTSRVKDALEDHLRREVCAGRLSLAAAQQELARDWIAAYRRHFRAQAPVEAHARFIKDSPWSD